MVLYFDMVYQSQAYQTCTHVGKNSSVTKDDLQDKWYYLS